MKTKFFAVVIAVLLFSGICFAQPGERPMKKPSLEERLQMVGEKICDALKLDNAKRETVVAAYENFFREMDILMESGSSPQMMPDRSKVEALENTRNAKIKLVLSESDYTKFLELDLATRPRHPRDGEGNRPQ